MHSFHRGKTLGLRLNCFTAAPSRVQTFIVPYLPGESLRKCHDAPMTQEKTSHDCNSRQSYRPDCAWQTPNGHQARTNEVTRLCPYSAAPSRTKLHGPDHVKCLRGRPPPTTSLAAHRKQIRVLHLRQQIKIITNRTIYVILKIILCYILALMLQFE